MRLHVDALREFKGMQNFKRISPITPTTALKTALTAALTVALTTALKTAPTTALTADLTNSPNLRHNLIDLLSRGETLRHPPSYAYVIGVHGMTSCLPRTACYYRYWLLRSPVGYITFVIDARGMWLLCRQWSDNCVIDLNYKII